MTNEEINALTDPQINVMMTVAIKKISNYKVHSKPNGDYVEFLDCVGVIDYVKVDDYCNDPAVIMPIVFEQKINLISSTGDLWGASWNDGGGKWSIDDYKHHHKNPLRAAAIVYLKMNGVL